MGAEKRKEPVQRGMDGDSPANWLLMANAMLANFLAGAAARIFYVAMPTIAGELRTDMLWVSWAILSYQISNIGLGLIFGRIGDIFGRRKVLAASYLVMTIGSLLCGLSASISYLVGFRVLQGAGAAMAQAVGRALAAEAMPEKKGGKAQGLMTTAFHFGFLLGPSVGGFIVDEIGWRWTFFCLIPFGALGALLTISDKEFSRGEGRRSEVDYLGATLLVIASTVLTLLLDRGTARLLDPSAKTIMTLVLLGSLAGFFITESLVASPMVNLSLFKNKTFAISSASLLIMSLNYSLSAFIFPFYLQEVLRLSPSFMGVLFMAAPIFTVAFGPVSGYLADRMGLRLPTTLGVTMCIASIFLGWFFRTDSRWLLPGLALVLIGLANGFFNPANSVGMLQAVPKRDMGLASGTLTLMFSLGTILGISLGGFAMTFAFQAHTGISGAAPTPENPVAFVAALNDTFLAAAAIGFIPLVFSLMREAAAGHAGWGGTLGAKRN